MCCCCPPAISALFCLWVQSGCSKGAVAGALTFFPPEPPFYKMERYDKDGNLLGDDYESDDETDENNHSHDDDDDEDNVEDGHRPAMDRGGDDDEDNDASELIPASGRAPDIENKKKKNKNRKKKKKSQRRTDDEDDENKSPAQQLVDRAAMLRERGKRRNKRDAADYKNGVTYRLLLDPRIGIPSRRGLIIQPIKIPSKTSHIATVVARIPSDHITPKTKTIIISHGNATDIGAMHGLQHVLAQSLHANIVLYDYSGYGSSSGVATENNTYTDVASVYDYVVKEVSRNDPSQVVLYGQSVGSGPSCHLCTRHKDVGGLILHSPFTSGMRVLTPSRLLACLDIYPNINRIKKVNCPTMVIHGKLDEEVDISHGLAMHEAVPTHLQREPWWVPDRGHNDITDGPGKMAEYIRRLRTFLSQLDE